MILSGCQEKSIFFEKMKVAGTEAPRGIVAGGLKAQDVEIANGNRLALFGGFINEPPRSK